MRRESSEYETLIDVLFGRFYSFSSCFDFFVSCFVRRPNCMQTFATDINWCAWAYTHSTHICMLLGAYYLFSGEREYECLPHEYLKHMRMAEKTYVLSMLYLIC